MQRPPLRPLRRIAMLALLAAAAVGGTSSAEDLPRSDACVPLPSTAEATSMLPKLRGPIDSELPAWARALAPTLPHTAAATLELDYKFRTVAAEQLRLRSLARLAVAQANRSPYGEAYARADLARCGANELAATDAANASQLPPLERDVYAFARQMTLAGRDATDAQVAALKEQLGEESLVGLVLHIGYGNFQDRLVHSLQLDVEPTGPLPPVAVDFVDSTPTGRNTPAADRPESEPSDPSGGDISKRVQLADAWGDFDPDQLQAKLESQRGREPRIRVPEWAEIAPKLPEGLYTRPMRIRWSRTVVGYQPVLGPAWIKCLRVFEQEAHQDRVFEESVFWVVTRGLKCFYCMGHCEMLMEVGGLDAAQIADRTARLAGGDWSSFTPAEQAAFGFAHKMTTDPAGVTCDDFAALREALGPQRALDCVWWVSRCQFMTKVSDAFQLQLEEENVFADQLGTTGMTAEQLTRIEQAALAAADSAEARKALADELNREFAPEVAPEAVRMLAAIAGGSMMGPDDGWFGPGELLYDWAWLAQRHGVAADANVKRDDFAGEPELFDRLDRNRDGRLAAADFDWSDDSPWVRQASVVNRVFRAMDRGGDGRVTGDDLENFFDAARGEADSLSPEDLRDLILGGGGDFSPGDAPTPAKLIRGLFAGEIGSVHQGPQVGEPAPDFTLPTQDGSAEVRLRDAAAERPVVLVFGNFTCGPFRRNYPEVEALYQRYKDRANFLAVYIREAHPEDGWHMESNDAAGVKLAQPKTDQERRGVAGVCRERIGLTMPLLVDGVDDAVGHAYSGMPSRLYVIARGGRVVYKSGRGPYGFKPGELEQALLLTLLAEDARPTSSPAASAAAD